MIDALSTFDTSIADWNWSLCPHLSRATEASTKLVHSSLSVTLYRIQRPRPLYMGQGAHSLTRLARFERARGVPQR